MPVESIYLRFDGLQQDLNDRLRALSELASPERGTPEWSKLEDITHEIAEIYRSEEAGIQFRLTL